MQGTVTKEKRGHDIHILVDGESVKSFNEISDDYAYTNADQYMRALKEALPAATSLTDAANRAWCLM
jgi:recombinational DNA repair protein (RecF pathway)